MQRSLLTPLPADGKTIFWTEERDGLPVRDSGKIHHLACADIVAVRHGASTPFLRQQVDLRGREYACLSLIWCGAARVQRGWRPPSLTPLRSRDRSYDFVFLQPEDLPTWKDVIRARLGSVSTASSSANLQLEADA